MRENPVVALSRRSWRDRHPDNDDRPAYRKLRVVKAQQFWRARRGFKVHRIRSGVIFINQGGRMTADWWCGNVCHEPIAIKPGCDEGLSPCDACERNWTKARGTCK